ncbi:hypothetical protein ACFRH4_42225 [Streptomyces mirabilis]|uniref:hypothetical protein n=1 Tax=Streptomyces mirabilis TaxID=68239 RepID=UPI00368BD98E
MSDWCRLPGGTPLPPRVAPLSGSTLCAAAWVAHLTGWTLVDADDLVQVTVRLPGGTEYQRYYSYAHRNGERRTIASVADVTLGLEPDHDLWIGSADTALSRLREGGVRGPHRPPGGGTCDRHPPLRAGRVRGKASTRVCTWISPVAC